MCKFELDYLKWWMDTHLMVVSRGKKISFFNDPFFSPHKKLFLSCMSNCSVKCEIQVCLSVCIEVCTALRATNRQPENSF